jgi:hypothetical protein
MGAMMDQSELLVENSDLRAECARLQAELSLVAALRHQVDGRTVPGPWAQALFACGASATALALFLGVSGML